MYESVISLRINPKNATLAHNRRIQLSYHYDCYIHEREDFGQGMISGLVPIHNLDKTQQVETNAGSGLDLR